MDRGEELIITRNGLPVGELRPVQRRQFVPIEERQRVFAGTGRIDHKTFRRDVARYLDQSVEPSS